MKVLYLHGLDSNGLTPEKREVLEAYDLEVDAPLTDYRKSKLGDFEDLIKVYTPEILIGSSMGGRICYRLSNKFNIPALLINPAIGHNLCEEIVPIDDFMHSNKCNKQLFVFGEKDDIVSMDTVISKTGPDIHCITIENMYHSVTPEEIDTAIFYFLNNIYND